jgi:hypothetical protein
LYSSGLNANGTQVTQAIHAPCISSHEDSGISRQRISVYYLPYSSVIWHDLVLELSTSVLLPSFISCKRPHISASISNSTPMSHSLNQMLTCATICSSNMPSIYKPAEAQPPTSPLPYHCDEPLPLPKSSILKLNARLPSVSSLHLPTGLRGLFLLFSASIS